MAEEGGDRGREIFSCEPLPFPRVLPLEPILIKQLKRRAPYQNVGSMRGQERDHLIVKSLDCIGADKAGGERIKILAGSYPPLVVTS